MSHNSKFSYFNFQTITPIRTPIDLQASKCLQNVLIKNVTFFWGLEVIPHILNITSCILNITYFKTYVNIFGDFEIIFARFFVVFFHWACQHFSTFSKQQWLVGGLLVITTCSSDSGPVHNVNLTLLPKTLVWVWPRCFLHQLPLFFLCYVTFVRGERPHTDWQCKCVCVCEHEYSKSQLSYFRVTAPLSGFIWIILIRQYHRSANT